MMNAHPSQPVTNCLKSCVCVAILIVLPLLSPVQAQAPDATPNMAGTAISSNTPTVNKNIYVAGGSVRLIAPVRGDLYAAGGRVMVEQTVQGDATLAGGALNVRAPIADDLRAAGGDITRESSVGGELLASGGSITLGKSGVISGAATLYAGNVTIEGKVNGPLKVYAEKVVVNGEVAGDVELNAGQIELGPQTKLVGSLRYSSNAEFKSAEGAVIGGAVTRGGAMNGRPDMHHDRQWHGEMMGGGGWEAAIFGTLFGYVALMALAALFLLVFTGFTRRASATLQVRPWLALAAGVAVFFGVPMAAILLCFTLIGIPLGIVLLVLWPLMLLAGLIVGVFCIAQQVQRAVQKQVASPSSAATMGFFALTLLLVLLIGSLPFVGGFMVGALALLGTGGCALELYRQARASKRPPASGGSSTSSATTLPHTNAVGSV